MADEGGTIAAVPGRPPRLTHEELRRAQAETLEGPRRRYGLAARALFTLLDPLADVFRQIAHDERVHKLESEALMKESRFR